MCIGNCAPESPDQYLQQNTTLLLSFHPQSLSLPFRSFSHPKTFLHEAKQTSLTLTHLNYSYRVRFYTMSPFGSSIFLLYFPNFFPFKSLAKLLLGLWGGTYLFGIYFTCFINFCCWVFCFLVEGNDASFEKLFEFCLLEKSLSATF